MSILAKTGSMIKRILENIFVPFNNQIEVCQITGSVKENPAN